ncbi:MAG: transposase [Acidobacteria bacterium]|nr:transposase [Acidobacteriota bacterium]MBI3422127.1 transposase [Acidobacteriota bacterium]
MSEQSERKERGLVIAAKCKITQQGNTWKVPSQSGYAAYYFVNPDPKSPRCTCPDFEKREAKCKHIYAVEIVVERETSTTTTTDAQGNETTTTTETVTVTKKVTYGQDWTAYNQAQQNEKRLFQSLMHDLCGLVVEPEQEMGRPRLAYRDMLFAAAFKVYCGMSARRFATDLSEAQAKGYVSKAAHFNSVNRYLDLDNEALTPLLQSLIAQSSLPLKALETDFAVDSSGFSTCNYVRWFDEKYGKERTQNQWVKAHLMCGVKTHIVTSVEITGKDSNDSPQLPGLVEKTAKSFDVKEVSADKGYSSLENHDAIAKVGATPYIAFKANATGEKGGLFQKMYHYYQYKRDEFLAYYHRRSNVESTFNMIKAKFSTRLRSKDDTAQINEALCKVLCHNICVLIQSMFEFGIVPQFCGEVLIADPS